jgi:hypothetical protein
VKVRRGLFAMIKKAKDESHRLWASRMANDLLKAEISWSKYAGGNEKQRSNPWESQSLTVLLLAAEVAEGRSLSKGNAEQVASIKPHFDLLVEFIVNHTQGAVRRGKGKPKVCRIARVEKLTSKRKIIFNVLDQFPELAAPGITPQILLSKLREMEVWREAVQAYSDSKDGVRRPLKSDPNQRDLQIVKEALYAYRRRNRRDQKIGGTGR